MSRKRSHSPLSTMQRLLKRFKSNAEDEEPAYMDGIPRNLIRSEASQLPESCYPSYFRVERNYTSKLLGEPATAMFQFAIDNAEWTRHSTREFLQIVRTYHNTLKMHDHVYFGEIRRGYYAWVVSHPDDPQLSTHAAGVPIHVQLPSHTGFLTPNTTTNIHQPVADFTRGAPVNGTAFLTSKDIQFARRFCPRAIGLQVLVVGEVRALYRSFEDIEKDWEKHHKIDTLGTCLFKYEVATCKASRPPASEASLVSNGQTVSVSPVSTANPSLATKKHVSDQTYNRGCVGLKLRLTEGSRAGQELITTSAHAWTRDNNSTWRCFEFLCHGLSRLGSLVNWSFDNKPNMQGRVGETSIGREVLIEATNSRVGTIAETYDRLISQRGEFSEGLTHDLALIGASPNSALPEIRSPMNRPRVSGWASLRSVMHGEPLFVMQTELNQTPHALTEGPLSTPTAAEQRRQNKEALAVYEGYEYRFDERSTREGTIALLWRTSTEIRPELEQDEESLTTTSKNTMSAVGSSSGILCLGRPTDAECKAVVFQNFQVQYLYPFRKAVQRCPDKELVSTVTSEHPSQMAEPYWYKGGFLLPQEIRSSEILMSEKEASKVDTNSLPIAGRKGRRKARVYKLSRHKRQLELTAMRRDGHVTD